MEEYFGKVKINYDYYTGEDLYSDGSVEDELLEIVKKYNMEDYSRIIAEKRNWAITYHLSELRQHIIEWYPFSANDDILEIGSGCGAISGAFAKKCNSLTCVELSKKRSLINAYRNRDHDNIEIILGNYQDIEPNLEKKYDYVTLIGVLEYAEAYIDGEDAYVKLINSIKPHLKENGKLIVAIENKYGLKYWAGCKEDHTSMYYEGLEGYTHTKGVKTFSKGELVSLIKQCGMKIDKFYYPYPDYKLPVEIYSDEYMPRVGELNNNLINLDNDRIISFNEDKVYDNLISDGMFDMFSNSYLFFASKGE